MGTYLIACDGDGRVASLREIAAVVRQTGESWTRVLDAVWYVRSPDPIEVLAARFDGLLGEEDGLVIQPVAQDPMLLNTARRWFSGDRSGGSDDERLAA